MITSFFQPKKLYKMLHIFIKLKFRVPTKNETSETTVCTCSEQFVKALEMSNSTFQQKFLNFDK